MIDYVGHVTDESLRFGAVLRSGDLEATVPSCPGWTLADLGFHLAEVQYFWASIVEGPLTDPSGVEELVRPGSDTDIPALFDLQSLRLVTALRQRETTELCWTWHESGATVGWVARRQAHEALIHRVDAEMTNDSRTPLDRVLAVDGVDEVLKVMAGGYPSWGSFEPDGRTIAVVLDDDDASWQVTTGRMTGTSPRTGVEYDLEAMVVVDGAADATTTLSGPADAMDLWLWGRGGEIETTGNPADAAWLRQIVAEETQ